MPLAATKKLSLARKTGRRAPLVLVILDGWGINPQTKGNAIALAKKPVLDLVYKNYPHTKLEAASTYVGLPPGQPGNSEAGHMNIGAGRVIEQDAVTISKSISNGTFFKNPAFLQAAKHVNDHHSSVHLMGLLSENSSPHADNDHIISLLSFFLAKTKGKIYLHLFTDGRDSPKFAALKVLSQYKSVFNGGRVAVASIMGRFYAMDRKKFWSRTQAAYQAMVLGRGRRVKSAIEAVSQAYNREESDEFISPSVIIKKGRPVTLISDHDAVIFFNLRSDRARQLAKVFAQEDFEKKNKRAFRRIKFPKDLMFVALTDFGPDLDNIITAYPGVDIPDTLPVALHGRRQLYIAETEKYAHVSYFFNGGYDHTLVGELRINIPSPDVDSYDQRPEMSTERMINYVIKEIKKFSYDFITINIASPDMIGHTGNLPAAVRAVEVVDKALGKLKSAVLAPGGTLIITGDHGNVEQMINPQTGEVDTEHSTFPVPFIIVSDRKKYKLRRSGQLANIAPTILDMLGLKKPKLMTAKSLIIK